MTEADSIELVATCAENTFTAFSIFISFTFAFLATAFFVGNKLTRFQALAASGTYAVSAGIMALASLTWLQALFLVMDSQITLLDKIPFLNPDVWVPGVSIFLVVGIFISLYFMWDVRHPKAE